MLLLVYLMVRCIRSNGSPPSGLRKAAANSLWGGEEETSSNMLFPWYAQRCGNMPGKSAPVQINPPQPVARALAVRRAGFSSVCTEEDMGHFVDGMVLWVHNLSSRFSIKHGERHPPWNEYSLATVPVTIETYIRAITKNAVVLNWPGSLLAMTLVLLQRLTETPVWVKCSSPVAGRDEGWDNAEEYNAEVTQWHRLVSKGVLPKTAKMPEGEPFVWHEPCAGDAGFYPNNQHYMLAACFCVASKMHLDTDVLEHTTTIAQRLKYPQTNYAQLAQHEYQTLRRLNYEAHVTEADTNDMVLELAAMVYHDSKESSLKLHLCHMWLTSGWKQWKYQYKCHLGMKKNIFEELKHELNSPTDTLGSSPVACEVCMMV